jgi:uncharacterized glyoxalase superfamily protein PhnB
MCRFWCAAVGYQPVEKPAEMPDDAGFGVEFHAAHHPAGRQAGPRLYFQRVPEAKAAKNRVHLDINCADLEGECARLLALGARRVRRFDEPWGESWIWMEDPEGNEFCVQCPAPQAGS